MKALIQNTRLILKLLAVVLVLIGLNMLAGRLNLQWDMTEAGIHSLSEKTRETVSNLKTKATIYFFHDPSQSNPRLDAQPIHRMLDRIDQLTDQVKIRKVNPTQRPSLAREHNIQSNNSIVIELGGQSKKLAQFDLYNFGRRGQSPSFRGESELVSSLINMSRATERKIYVTTGHGELQLRRGQKSSLSAWSSELQNEGYEVESLNPVVNDLPDTRDLLVIPGPSQPMPDPLLEKIRQWHRQGGNLLLAAGPNSAPGLNPILANQPVSFERVEILDPNRRIRSFQGLMNPFIFAPVLQSHPAVNSIMEQGLVVQLGRSTAINVTGDTPQVIMKTSSEAYGKDPDREQSGESSLEFNPQTDRSGPFTVAASISNGPGKLVVIGNANLFSNGLLRQGPANSNFAVNLANWIFDRQVSLGIQPTPMNYNTVTVTTLQAWYIQFVALALIPAIILIWGGWVWWNRKNR